MKRIAIAILATLTLSLTGLAAADNLEDYGSVLRDQVASSSSHNAPETNLENHGSVLLDGVSANRGEPRHIERGLNYEISVGDADSLFETDTDDNF